MSRPALQRLLSRPTTLDFLQLLIGAPVSTTCGCMKRSGQHARRREGQRVGFSMVARGDDGKRRPRDAENRTRTLVPREKSLRKIYHESTSPGLSGIVAEAEPRKGVRRSAILEEDIDLERLREDIDAVDGDPDPLLGTRKSGHFHDAPSHLPIIRYHPSSSQPDTTMLTEFGLKQEKLFGKWARKGWSFQELDMISNFAEDKKFKRARSLMDVREGVDMQLWGYLLDFRERTYGRNGVKSFFKAMVNNDDVKLPTSGLLADKLWMTFLNFGFAEGCSRGDDEILKWMLMYADGLFAITKQRWPKLYVTIIEHFLLHGPQDEVWSWHTRLLQDHYPSPEIFADFCRDIILKHGNLKALRAIYPGHRRRNDNIRVYNTVIPALCEQENYYVALQWHFLLFKMGDLPTSSKVTEPLVHFLAVWNPGYAKKVTESLVKAGVSFALNLDNQVDDTILISREMVNRLQGRSWNIPVKKYNDTLGARWFATTWISVDTTINAVHALGIQEIGPLSLQAIALRDPNHHAITQRLDQLKDLGISIGSSLYAKALDHFARTRKKDHLKGLLESDQHPDELENSKLQEELLAAYAHAGEWSGYRRTLAIRSLASTYPEIEMHNLILRNIIKRRNTGDIVNYIRLMRKEGVTITVKTIDKILSSTLIQRRRAHRPMKLAGVENRGKDNDLNKIMYIFRIILFSGSFIPTTRWREIVRRLGMMGRWEDVERLCLFLAKWYGPSGTDQGQYLKTKMSRFRVPACVPTNNPLHPLKILFNKGFQMALVEWGFIIALKKRPIHRVSSKEREMIRRGQPIPKVTWGIELLKKLNAMGVWVDGKTVRSAVIDRLIVYYGPGKSSRVYNRFAKQWLQGKIGEVAKQVDDALEGKYFTAPGLDLERVIGEAAARRWDRVRRRWWMEKIGGSNNPKMDLEIMGEMPQNLRPLGPPNRRRRVGGEGLAESVAARIEEAKGMGSGEEVLDIEDLLKIAHEEFGPVK